MSSDEPNEKESSKSKDETSAQLNEVHSANKWEQADLGDDDRKKKFLRLMGAGKKDHHGKIVIGDHDKPHGRSKEVEEINEDLEEQYNEAMEHKKVSGFKGHMGLGFHQEQQKKEEESKEESKDEKSEEKSDDNKDIEKEEKTKECQKHKLEDNAEEKKEESSDPKKKKFMMNFVKSSS